MILKFIFLQFSILKGFTVTKMSQVYLIYVNKFRGLLVLLRLILTKVKGCLEET